MRSSEDCEGLCNKIFQDIMESIGKTDRSRFIVFSNMVRLEETAAVVFWGDFVKMHLNLKCAKVNKCLRESC